MHLKKYLLVAISITFLALPFPLFPEGNRTLDEILKNPKKTVMDYFLLCPEIIFSPQDHGLVASNKNIIPDQSKGIYL